MVAHSRDETPVSSTSSSDPGVDRLWVRLIGDGVARLISLGTAGLAVCTVLYFLAPYNRVAETTTHFVPFYAMCGVAGMIAALLLRRRTLAILCGLFAVFYVALIAPWYLQRPMQPVGSAPNLRIVTVNVLSINKDADRLQRFVAETNPDVIFVQEYSPMWARAFESLRMAYPHFVERTRSDHFGIALFSKLPLENAEVFNPAGEQYPAIRADVRVNDRLVTLLNLHPTPPVLRDLFAVRNRQLADAAAIARDQDDLVIAAGDLNVTMWSPYYRRFESESELRNTRRGFGIRLTWPANMPLLQLPLDHVLVSPDILTVDFAVGPDIGSDHLPVVVELWVSTRGKRGY